MEITVDRSIRLWWVYILRGLLFLGAGVYIFSQPVSAFLALGFMFGLVIFLAGIAELLRAYQDKGSATRGWHLFTGIIDVLIGLILMSHLGASMTVLRIIIGFYFLFKGVTLLSMRKHHGNIALMVSGALVILIFVILIWFNPAFGSMTIIVWTGLAFVVTGFLNLMLGIRMRRLQN